MKLYRKLFYFGLRNADGQLETSSWVVTEKPRDAAYFLEKLLQLTNHQSLNS